MVDYDYSLIFLVKKGALTIESESKPLAHCFISHSHSLVYWLRIRL